MRGAGPDSHGLVPAGDGTAQLVKQEHRTIGTVELFGRTLWQGWPMLAALAYSVIPLMVLGRRKLPLARALHDKSIATDADLNKDDWLTGTMAALGVGGIAMGWWWADAVAGVMVSLLVCRDGLRNPGGSIGDLMDRSPVSMDHRKIDVLSERVVAALEQLPRVIEASVRLREHGNFIIGEVFVIPRGSTMVLGQLEDAGRRTEAIDWRLRGINVVPLDRAR